MQFAARQRRLEHVARVHRAFGLARADHGVQLVDEDDVAAVVLAQLFQHGLQAFFELAAELGAGQQGRQVQGQHALAAQALGHFVVDDALRQAFDDGGLAHAGFADQHGVVLGAALQDLDRAADFVVAADHGIQLALAGALGQVHRVLGQGFAVGLAFGAGDVFAAAHGVDRGFQGLLLQARFTQDAAGVALVVGQRQQEELAGDVGVAAARGFLVGARQHALQVAAHLDVVFALHLRQGLQGVLEGRRQPVDRHPGPRQQAAGAAVGIRQQGGQYVDGLDVGVIVAGGQTLSVGQGLLELGCKFVESHNGRSGLLGSLTDTCRLAR
ncbi:hypothetical protein D3C85_971240 [compost metagenome]